MFIGPPAASATMSVTRYCDHGPSCPNGVIEHQIRLGVAFCRVRVPEPLRTHPSRRTVFEHDVRPVDQTRRHLLRCFRAFHVQHDRALVRVVIPEVQRAIRPGDVVHERPNCSRRRPGRGLHLHDVRPHVSQQLAGQLSQLVAKLDHPQPRQRPAHMSTPLARSSVIASSSMPSTSRSTSSVCSPQQRRRCLHGARA